jgi:hypothetical protein
MRISAEDPTVIILWNWDIHVKDAVDFIDTRLLKYTCWLRVA